jgi:hypothetical protein
MEQYKPYLIKPGIDDGSPRYWQELQEGYQLIERYRQTLKSAEKAHMFYARGYSVDGEPSGIHENLGPWEAVDEAAAALANSKAAIRILQAHTLTVEQLSPEGGVIIRNKEGYDVRSREIPILGVWEQWNRKPA